MTALPPILFAAIAILAVASMFTTARRYAGAVLALGEPQARAPKPLSRRSIASRSHSRVRTPSRAAMRGKRALRVRGGV